MVFLLKSCSLFPTIQWYLYSPSSTSTLTVVTIIRQFFYFSYRTIFFLQSYDVQLYWATTYKRVALLVIVMLLPLLLLCLLPIIRIIYTSHKHSNLPFKSIKQMIFSHYSISFVSLLIMKMCLFQWCINLPFSSFVNCINWIWTWC